MRYHAERGNHRWGLQNIFHISVKRDERSVKVVYLLR
jgi:hypothetical protein